MPLEVAGVKQIAVPATNTAIRELQSKQVANMVILGASMAITRVVTKRALIISIRENIEERFRESNLKALEAGFDLGGSIESTLAL